MAVMQCAHGGHETDAQAQQAPGAHLGAQQPGRPRVARNEGGREEPVHGGGLAGAALPQASWERLQALAEDKAPMAAAIQTEQLRERMTGKFKKQELEEKNQQMLDLMER